MSQSSARPCAVAIVTSFVLSLAFGPGCTVRLEAGTYHTRQQVVQGFRGTFSGAGSDRTIIEPLAPLRVSQDENVLARPPSVENPWPILFLFIDADMDVRDLGFRVTPPEVTETWTIFGMEIRVLATLLSITGERSRVDVERVAMESGEGTFMGVNVINGIFVQGVLPGPSGGFGDRPPFEGTVTIRDSVSRGPDCGVCVENLQRATVRLLDNRFDGVLSVYIENVSESLVEVRGNELTGSEAAAFVSAGGLRTPEGPGTVVIAGNTLRTGPEGHGVLISDTGDRPTLQVLAEGNLLELEEATAAVGGGATSVVVRGNVIRGSAAAGMRVGAAPHPETASGDDPEAPPAALGWVLLDNDVSALRADVAPIWVTDGATGTIVACRAGTDVRDEGVATTLACD